MEEQTKEPPISNKIGDLLDSDMCIERGVGGWVVLCTLIGLDLLERK